MSENDLDLLGLQARIAHRLDIERLHAQQRSVELGERLTEINRQHRDAVDEMVMLRHQLRDARTRHRKATRLVAHLRRDHQRITTVLASIRAERDDLRGQVERWADAAHEAGGKKLRRRLEKANAALQTTRDQIAAAHREIDKCGSGLGGTTLPGRVRVLVYRWEFERKRADTAGQELTLYRGYKARVEELREEMEGVRAMAVRDRRALEDERRVREDMIAAAVRAETSALTSRVLELETLNETKCVPSMDTETKD